MKLYHASQTEIRTPDIYYGRKNADFGQGFYLTTDRDFALKWANDGFFINEYVFDPSGLKIHHFKRNPDWYQYIFQNRRTIDHLDADVIIGPIANDTIFDTFGIISSGYLSDEEALSLLRIGPEYTQVVIKSERAVSQLKWICAEKVYGIAEHQKERKQAEENYQTQIAKKMQEHLN